MFHPFPYMTAMFVGNRKRRPPFNRSSLNCPRDTRPPTHKAQMDVMTQWFIILLVCCANFRQQKCETAILCLVDFCRETWWRQCLLPRGPPPFACTLLTFHSTHPLSGWNCLSPDQSDIFYWKCHFCGCARAYSELLYAHNSCAVMNDINMKGDVIGRCYATWVKKSRE